VSAFNMQCGLVFIDIFCVLTSKGNDLTAVKKLGSEIVKNKKKKIK